MKQIVFTFFLLFLAAYFSAEAFGQRFRDSVKSPKSVMQTLQDICKAYEKADTGILLKYMTEDFTLTASDGTITTRDDEIKELKGGKVRYELFENRDMKVRLHDKTAVVTGRTFIKGEYEKTPIEAEFQFTDTLIWKSGHWLIVSSHASRIKPKS